MYWTAVNYESPKYGEMIWNENGFEIWDSSSRLYLFKGKYKLAAIINGMEGYEKKYKCNPLRWIDAVRKKDLNKIKRIRLLSENALKEADFIELLWLEGSRVGKQI